MNGVGPSPARLLATPLKFKLLDIDITASLYLKNGFRLISSPANVEEDELVPGIQCFRQIYRLSKNRAMAGCIQTGYDNYAALDDLDTCLERLYDPQYRIVSELFWPHVAKPLFEQMKADRHVASPQVLRNLNKAASCTNGVEAAMIKHGLAIGYHNLAIANDLALLQGEAEGGEEHWQQALKHWSEVLESDVFWQYLTERASDFDHPSLKPQDVALLREQLPRVLLGINEHFSTAFAAAKKPALSARHIALVYRSGLPEEAKKEILGGMMKKLVGTLLLPLVQRINDRLLGVQDPIDRRSFDGVCQPILLEMLAVRNAVKGYLIEQMELPSSLMELAHFDQVCELLLQSLAKKLNYKTEDNARCILYSMLATKRILEFPLSNEVRRRLEQSYRNDREALYGAFMRNQKDSQGDSRNLDATDPTACWFFGSEETDPDSSLEIVFHRITHVSSPISVSYQTRPLLVPRSQYAAAVHLGKKDPPLPRKVDTGSVQNKIGALNSERKTRTRKAEEERDSAFARAEEAHQISLNDIGQKIADAEKEYNGEVARVQSRLQKDLSSMEVSLRKATARVKFEYSEVIAKQETISREVRKRNQGMTAALQLEFPLSLIFALPLAFKTALRAYQEGSASLSSMLTDFGIALIVGIVAGLLVGRLAREFSVTKAARAVEEVKAELAAKIHSLNRKRTKMVEERNAKAKEALSAARAPLEQITNQEADLKRRYEEELNGLRVTCMQKIKAIEEEVDANISVLRRKLEASLKPRPESDKKEFPAYKAAKANGWVEGASPSDYEVGEYLREHRGF